MADKTSQHAWAEGFPDLAGRPGRYVLCEGKVGFAIVTAITPNGDLGLVIRMELPDGRAALAGLDLLGTIDRLFQAADDGGLRIVLGLAERPQAPAQGMN